MPELPEVEAARRLVQRLAVGRRIVEVWCARDPIVFDGRGPARVRRALRGRRVLAARRHGKHLWLELDRRPWPCLHFGMSGGLHAPRAPGVALASHRGRDPAGGWPPRFTKLRLWLDDGGELALADARRLGRVRLRDDPARQPPIAALGFDALRGVPPPARFLALLRARSASLKAVLLDQSFAAGVGNWIADEILYQARLDPRRSAASLSDRAARRLRAALVVVVATAARAGADSRRYPRRWLFHRRWDRRVTATARGERLRRATIAGRTTVWVQAARR